MLIPHSTKTLSASSSVMAQAGFVNVRNSGNANPKSGIWINRNNEANLGEIAAFMVLRGRGTSRCRDRDKRAQLRSDCPTGGIGSSCGQAVNILAPFNLRPQHRNWKTAN